MNRNTLRILRVAGDVYPERVGGGAIHVHLLSKRQAEMGHDVTLFTSDYGDDDAPRHDHRDGYDLRRFKEVCRPFGNTITPGLFKSLRRVADDYDIIHAHSHLYFSTNLTAALTREIDTPLMVTNHGLYSQSAPHWIQELFLSTVARFTFNSAERVLCYSETDRDRLNGRGISSSISVIPNGVDCSHFQPDSNVEERPQVLYVGRLNRTKGVDKLVDAFARVHREYPEARLKIVGDGPFAPELKEQIVDLGISETVKFAGRVKNRQLPEMYDESAVFVLPSETEGFPRTVLEAMACETPPITSDLPQLKAALDGVGRTVSPDNIETLANEIVRLLADDKTRRSMATRGRELVRAKYSWEQTVARTTEEYYNVLEEVHE
ncbi:glycosyltransferase family 4 protein (plasmid) [Halorussus limi]|uniref:Glycosyltransferase family 4 protein n=1 Tax=Halorussus limi TaxID=2938695 RepID=A0A8U0I0D3_9EURY|nr:glycosyltransferase family 4 protein [Halorussus limi]UPV76638.1 glycosyltransferase family 4 protein [Halorussus limi]